jgi:serine/threonine-protein kinase RsbW
MMTEDIRVVEISIPNELGYEKIARAVVADTARKMGFSGEKVEDLKTAVAEACTNAIEYGNSFDAEAQVLVILSSDQNSISVRVVDEGRRPIPTPLPDKPARDDRQCLGLYLMQRLMDDVKINCQPGRNEVLLTSYL